VKITQSRTPMDSNKPILFMAAQFQHMKAWWPPKPKRPLKQRPQKQNIKHPDPRPLKHTQILDKIQHQRHGQTTCQSMPSKRVDHSPQ
jgi:proline racemase